MGVRPTAGSAFTARATSTAGRNTASIFHRLQLTLFHAGRLDTLSRPMSRPPVSVSGWAPDVSQGRP